MRLQFTGTDPRTVTIVVQKQILKKDAGGEAPTAAVSPKAGKRVSPAAAAKPSKAGKPGCIGGGSSEESHCVVASTDGMLEAYVRGRVRRDISYAVANIDQESAIALGIGDGRCLELQTKADGACMVHACYGKPNGQNKWNT